MIKANEEAVEEIVDEKKGVNVADEEIVQEVQEVIKANEEAVEEIVDEKKGVNVADEEILQEVFEEATLNDSQISDFAIIISPDLLSFAKKTAEVNF